MSGTGGSRVVVPEPYDPCSPSVAEIAGVLVTPRRQITDDRGRIVHMLRADDDVFAGFGEVYFSWVHPGVVKGWHIHTRMTLNYTCPVGRVRLVLHDQRPGSPSRGLTREIELSPSEHYLVTVPPHVWNGFIGLGDHDSMVCNCATHPHDPEEILRTDPDDPTIGYRWHRNGLAG